MAKSIRKSRNLALKLRNRAWVCRSTKQSADRAQTVVVVVLLDAIVNARSTGVHRSQSGAREIIWECWNFNRAPRCPPPIALGTASNPRRSSTRFQSRATSTETSACRAILAAFGPIIRSARSGLCAPTTIRSASHTLDASSVFS